MNDTIFALNQLQRAMIENRLSLQWVMDHFSFEERKSLFLWQESEDKIPVTYFFSEEEIIRNWDFMEFSEVVSYFPVLSDANRIAYLKKHGNSFYNSAMISACELIKSDQLKLELLSYIYEKNLRIIILSSLKSDELKEQYIKNFRKDYKTKLIVSLEDDQNKRKYIKLGSDLPSIIASLKSDQLKEFYLNKYSLFLKDMGKAQIIVSFESNELKQQYLRKVKSEYEKVTIIRSLQPESLRYQYMQSFKKEESIFRIADTFHTDQYIIEALQKMKSISFISSLIYNVNDSEYLLEYFANASVDMRKSFCSAFFDKPEIRFFLLNSLDDFFVVKDVIDHTEEFDLRRKFFPLYSKNYEHILQLYSDFYHVPLDRLRILVQKTSMQALKVIDNVSIQHLLGLNDRNFNLMMGLLDDEYTLLNESSSNDIIYSLLQRKFKLEVPEILWIMPQFNQFINEKSREKIEKLCRDIDQDMAFLSLLEEKYSLEDFMQKLMDKDEKAITILHLIVNHYIEQKKEEYIRNNFTREKRRCLPFHPEKKAVIKEASMSMPSDYFFKLCGNLDLEKLSPEMKNLLEDRRLLSMILDFKRKPKEIKDDDLKEMKGYLKTFNQIMDLFYEKDLLEPWIDESKFTKLDFRNKNVSNLLSILCELDVKKLCEMADKNTDMYQKLVQVLKNEKFLAWGDTFQSLMFDSDVLFLENTVADLINHFAEFYPALEAKAGREKITITELIDTANCYGSSSGLYSLLLGDDNYQLLISNPSPNRSPMTRDARLEKSLSDIKEMYSKESIAVPPIDQDFSLDNKKKIHIAVGCSTDMDNLSLGEKTGSCMRIGGAGSSLFDFCLKDPNGFHVVFSNPKNGRFVSRVSGYRAGNTVFLNELRFSKIGEYSNQELSEFCKLLAQQFVEDSKGDTYPIDNVVISPYYAMSSGQDIKIVNLNIQNKAQILGNVYSDINPNSCILLATSSKDGNFVPFVGDKTQVQHYKPLRKKAHTYINSDDNSLNEITRRMHHIELLNQHLNDIPLRDATFSSIEDIQTACIGQDWYAVLHTDGEITTYLVEHPMDMERRKKEVQEAIQKLGPKSKVETSWNYQDESYDKQGGRKI